VYTFLVNYLFVVITRNLIRYNLPIIPANYHKNINQFKVPVLLCLCFCVLCRKLLTVHVLRLIFVLRAAFAFDFFCDLRPNSKIKLIAEVNVFLMLRI
jgi:hypothetical protein